MFKYINANVNVHYKSSRRWTFRRWVRRIYRAPVFRLCVCANERKTASVSERSRRFSHFCFARVLRVVHFTREMMFRNCTGSIWVCWWLGIVVRFVFGNGAGLIRIRRVGSVTFYFVRKTVIETVKMAAIRFFEI